jgi:hypothetical protein
MSEGKDIALVPENVPAHVLNAGLAREMNADAAAGIGTGFPPSIRIKNGKFRLVDGAGEETVLKAADLDEGTYLPMVVLRAKAGLSKVWYAKPYDPSAEASAPDCFSLDGIKPDPSVKEPQCETCAGCDMNAWGSGRNQAGQPTKGKACADNKILAVLYKGGVYQFKIPPASLKNWGVFVKNLSARDIPLGHVIVYVSFDEDADFSIMQFRVGKFVPEQAIPKLMNFVTSPEVAEIVNPMAPPNPPAKQPGADLPAPEPKTEPEASVADMFGEDKAQPDPAQTAAKEPTSDEPTLKDLKAEAKSLGVKGYSKMDKDELTDAIYEAKEGAEAEPAPVQQAEPAKGNGADVPSDDDIAASLGL